MKSLKEVKLSKIDPNKDYVIQTECFDRFDSTSDIMVGKGSEIAELLKETFNFEDFCEDDDLNPTSEKTWKKFMKHCTENQEEETFQVFELPVASSAN